MSAKLELIERNGELGYINTNNDFVKMTNWAPTVIGVIIDDSSVEGCLLEHPPAGTENEMRL
jgi:hypothetical protein